jgi:hypothetical protein
MQRRETPDQRADAATLSLLAQSSTLQRGQLGAWFSSAAGVSRGLTEMPACAGQWKCPKSTETALSR